MHSNLCRRHGFRPLRSLVQLGDMMTTDDLQALFGTPDDYMTLRPVVPIVDTFDIVELLFSLLNDDNTELADYSI